MGGGGSGDGDGVGDVGRRVGQRREHDLVRPGGHGDAAVEHRTEERAVGAVVGHHPRLVEVRGLLGSEEDTHQGTDPWSHHRQALGGDGLGQPVRQRSSAFIQFGVGVVVQPIQHGQSGGGGQRIPRQGARLVDGTIGCQERHRLGGAPEGAHGKTTADHLPEAPEVGDDPGVLGGSAGRDAEPGDDLVEDEQGPRSGAGVAKSLEEPGPGPDQPHVGGHRLDDHRRDRVVQLGHLVVRRNDRVGHGPGGDAGRIGQSLIGDARTSGREQAVGVAVIVAGELDDALPPGGATGHSDR